MKNQILTTGPALRDIAVELYYRGKHSRAAQFARNALADQASLSIEAIVQWSNLLAMCERAQGRYEEALKVHLEVSPLVESLDDDFLRGKFHNGLGITYWGLKQTDKAFEEYTAASVYYEMAREHRHRSDVESNLANLKIQAGRPEEAHAHLDKAALGCDDPEILGQIEDVRARAYLAERRTRDAMHHAALSVIRLLSTTNETALDESIQTIAQIAAFWPHERESERIKKALVDSAGHVATAAKLLGFKNRQTLENKIARHYPFLLPFRTPKRKRTKKT